MARTSKGSAQKKYERQKELAKERQRRRRAKMSQDDINKKRQYDRERYKQLKADNKRKSIHDLPEREQRKKRKMWKEQNKRRKERKEALAAAVPNTPLVTQTPESGQKRRGRTIVRRDRSKIYRSLKKKEQKIKELEKRLRKYKKRLEREKKTNISSPSPRKQVTRIVGKTKVSPKVKKQLLLGCILKKQLEDKVKASSHSKIETQRLRKSIGNKILKKYRVQGEFKTIMPYKTNRTLKKNLDPSEYTRKKRMGIRQRLKEELLTFFTNDTVSKMCPGKKDVVRQGKEKRQRRILLDTLYNLHKVFQEEAQCKISLKSFTRARPFWVTYPKKSDRDTCACIKHSNIELLHASLKRAKVIEQKNITDIINIVVCSPKNQQCMFGKCHICKNAKIEYSYDNDYKVKTFKWITVKERKKIKNKTKIVTKTVKVKMVNKISNLIVLFEKELMQFKKHLFCTIHQATMLKTKIHNLKKNELLFRVDFAENYVAKYNEEVQSVHFGASKKQLSMHTGVRYRYSTKNKYKVLPFCTVSDNLDHQSHAIWSHLMPILTKSANEFPDTDTIHFFTDSPTNQYRNRMNIFLFKKIVPGLFSKIKTMTWNFTESGHGKGPMDGIGGTLKREADRKVALGKDIINSADFIRVHSQSTIFIKEINAKLIEDRKEKVAQQKIPPIIGITQARQITYYKNGTMFANSLSCFDCPTKKLCKHFYLFQVFKTCKPKQKDRLRVEDIYTSEEEITDAQKEVPAASNIHPNSAEEKIPQVELPVALEECPSALEGDVQAAIELPAESEEIVSPSGNLSAGSEDDLEEELVELLMHDNINLGVTLKL